MSLFTNYQLAIITFCAEECARRKAGEAAVPRMLSAWNYACQRFAVDNIITDQDVTTLAEFFGAPAEGNALLDAVLFNVRNGTLYCPEAAPEASAATA